MTDLSTWADIYQSNWQSVWALLPVTAVFLAYRTLRALSGRGRPSQSIRPEAARFLDLYAIAFGITIFLDPIATGPFTRAAGIEDSIAGSAVAFCFVYLGDLRVFVLLFGLAQLDSPGRALLRAAAYALAVPIAAGLIFAAGQQLDPALAGGWLWVIHELLFLAWILWFRQRWIDRHVSDEQGETRRYLRDVCLLVACYYALWPISDLLVLLGSVDAGWALRMIPNQLYYAFFIPWTWFRFFRPPQSRP